eukprot:TRINITY_DN10130_c0_g1_i1.p1 TRINITY_DN10130_c0_g1~~TRINITY_DN10130_c0_g1_i1.p1  ORF type:complete len:864 (+),score=206.95 TRINITY_DN10130_c0_g1_i1:55-2646(+)
MGQWTIVMQWIHNQRKRFTRTAAYSLLSLIFAYGTLSCYSYALIREQTEISNVNTLCSAEDRPFYCDLGSDVHRFNKFVVFVTDGWPVKYAEEVLEFYKDHSVTYLVDVPGAKYSHAIYTSHLTGQLPTNYKGDPINGDHLLRSLLRSRSSNYKFQYVGPEWSFLAIFGKSNYDYFFSEVRIEKEALDINYVHPYPWFFENGMSGWERYANDLKSKGASMFAHSGVFDHRQHGEHRGLGPAGTSWPRTDSMARVISSDMKNLKNWIDKNPEYLFILISDHGVDEYGVGGYRMHGQSENGNEPFILMYNPSLEPKQRIKIDVVDVASTLTFYLEGADIPINSMGVAQPYFGENKLHADVKVAQQNLKQLSIAAKFKGVSYDSSQVERLLKIDSPNSETKNEILEISTKLKKSMYSMIHTPWFSILCFTLASSGVILYLLISFNEGLEVYVFENDYMGFVWNLSSVLGIYTPSFVNLLFCWWSWSEVMDDGNIPRIFSSILAIYICHKVRLSVKDSDSGLHPIERKIYICETINLLTIFVRSCFPDLMNMVDNLPVRFLITCFVMYLGKCFIVTSRVWEKYLLIFLLGSSQIYSWSMDYEWMFFKHMHIVAIIIWLGAFLVPMGYLGFGRPKNAMWPILSLMLLLHRDSNLGVLFLAIYCAQFLYLILPSNQFFRISLTNATVYRRDSLLIQSTSEGLQAMTMYMLNQTFFTFMFGLGQKTNFDVHPFAGRIGLEGYDTYAGFSALLMTLHKYGIFALFVVMSFDAITWPVQNGTEDRNLYPEAKTRFARWLSDLMTAVLILTFSMSNLGMYLMFWVATRYHPIEAAVATTLLVGTMGIVFCLLQAVYAYRTSTLQNPQTRLHVT